MLRAREVPADEARRIGLLDAVAPAGGALELALDWSDELAARSPAALTAILRCVDEADDRPLVEGLANEAKRVTALFEGPEAREGLAAFIEKRAPDYG